MKKNILLIIFCCTFFYSLAQNNNKRYRKETKNFLAFVRDTELKYADTIYLYNFLCNKNLNLFEGAALYSIKNGWFTPSEKEQIIKNILYDSSKFIFDNNFISRAKIVPELNDSVNKWNKWNHFIILSKPVFLRNYTLCIFSYGVLNGNETFLYIKENGIWIKLRLLGRNMSY